IQKLDPSGNYLWAKSFGGTSNDVGRSITVDASGNVYTTGSFIGTVDFDPGAGTNNLTAQGNDDVFIQKLDPSGNFLWAKSFGGTSWDYGYSIALDASGNVYTTGNFQLTVDFDPGAGTNNLTPQGGYDVFIQKMSQCSPTTGTDVQTACDTYTWIDGNTYTASNSTATFTLNNVAGCDSVVTLDLTIKNATTGTDVITACDSYIWIDGNTYTASNSTARFTLTNVAGCDSVVTLDLTINNSTTGTDVITACDSYTWIDGQTYTASNDSATFTLMNAAGCDSLVTLDLTINNSSTGIDVITACDSYTWIDGQTYTASNDSATTTLTNAAGCDSVVTLDLTITNSTAATDVQSACDSYTWIDGNTYTASNSTATFTLTNAAGCDSVVTLDLTINSVSDITTSLIGVTITATNSNATYQWLDCDNGFAPISGETNQAFMATANGNYTVELTENTCVDTTACVSITTVGITENSFGDAFAVYPNPTSGNFSINLGAFYDHAEVRITDVLGSIIQTKSIPETQQIDLSITSPSGLYIVTVDAGEKRAIIRVVKE
ncbi:MAG: T9SS type A sorting domain-containing protein, partial [Chitinophagales bacterium]